MFLSSFCSASAFAALVRFLFESHLQNFIKMFYEHEVQVLAELLRDINDILLVLEWKDHSFHTVHESSQALLFHTTDCEYASCKSYFTSHRDICTDCVVSHQRDECRRHRDTC